jgi:hypothetical protein
MSDREDCCALRPAEVGRGQYSHGTSDIILSRPHVVRAIDIEQKPSNGGAHKWYLSEKDKSRNCRVPGCQPVNNGARYT